MAHVIAVAGKGGVGKTTLCGMLIQYLCEKGKGPILAVDADANSNLNEVLGVKVETTLGDVREEIARAELAKRIQFLPECLKLIMRKCVLKMLWLRMMTLIFLLWEELRERVATVM